MILVFPPQSPSEVPVQGADAPAAVMSLKSVLDVETVAAVMVIAVPIVPPKKNIRLVTELPLQVNAPERVIVGQLNVSVLTAVPVLVRFVIVGVPVNEAAPEPLNTIVP